MPVDLIHSVGEMQKIGAHLAVFANSESSTKNLFSTASRASRLGFDAPVHLSSGIKIEPMQVKGANLGFVLVNGIGFSIPIMGFDVPITSRRCCCRKRW